MNYRELPPTEHGSPEWHKARLAGIGSSEIAGLMGLDDYDWSSPWSIWLRKTHRAPADDGIDTEAMFWGRALEPTIRQVAGERLGIEWTVPGTLQSVERPHMLYSPDGMAGDTILECKNTAWFMAAKWEDQIPDHAELQVHHGMYVTGAKRAIVAGLIGGNRLKVHEVERDERLIELIIQKADQFWFDHVVADVEPPITGTKADREAVTRLYPSGDGDVYVTREQIEGAYRELLDARKAEAAAARRKTAADNQIRKLMAGARRLLVGDQEWVKLKGGQLRTSEIAEENPDLFEEYLTARKFNSAEFREDHPDLYAKYQSTSLTLKEVA